MISDWKAADFANFINNNALVDIGFIEKGSPFTWSNSAPYISAKVLFLKGLTDALLLFAGIIVSRRLGWNI